MSYAARMDAETFASVHAVELARQADARIRALEAECARKDAALAIAVEGLEHIRDYMRDMAEREGLGLDSIEVKANHYLAAIKALWEAVCDA